MKKSRIGFIKNAFDTGGYRIDFSSVPPVIYQKRFKERPLGMHPNRLGYPQVALVFNGKTMTIPVHQIVAVMAGLRVDEHSVINHKDGNKTNYQISNLEVTSQTGNARHAIATGLKIKKLTPADVRDIRARYASGESARDLAEAYGVRAITINSAVKGRSFRGVEGVDLGRTTVGRNDAKVLTEEDVREIRYLRTKGMSYRDIGRVVGVCYNTVGDIIRGKTWRGVAV